MGKTKERDAARTEMLRVAEKLEQVASRWEGLSGDLQSLRAAFRGCGPTYLRFPAELVVAGAARDQGPDEAALQAVLRVALVQLEMTDADHRAANINQASTELALHGGAAADAFDAYVAAYVVENDTVRGRLHHVCDLSAALQVSRLSDVNAGPEIRLVRELLKELDTGLKVAKAFNKEVLKLLSEIDASLREEAAATRTVTTATARVQSLTVAAAAALMAVALHPDWGIVEHLSEGCRNALSLPAVAVAAWGLWCAFCARPDWVLELWKKVKEKVPYL